MVQVPVQPLTAEEYLRLKSWPYEGRLELEDGYIREVPTEERINTLIELFLIAELLKFLPVQRLSLGQVEVEVPAAKARFRNPDVMVLHPDHVSLLGNGRGTLRLPMPPPLLVVEEVSPGIDNEKRDYQDKRKDYAARGILEYWIVDPAKQSVSRWVGGEYEDEVKTGPERIVSSVLPQLDLSAQDLLQAHRSV
jgi:Uma2 family endonuclease